MKIIQVLILLTILSCHSASNESIKHSNLKDSLHKAIGEGTVDSNHIQDIYKEILNKNKIVGIWASDNKEPLTVVISTDSIFYTEHFESYKYDLKGDSIFIQYPDFIFSAKTYLINDTLIFESEGGQSKYYRFAK